MSSDPEELLEDAPLFTLLQPPSVYTSEPSIPPSPSNNVVIKRSRADCITSPEKRARFERTQYILAKSGLLEITKKTALLIKANQDAQEELIELRREVGEFVRSVLNNPDNQNRTKQATNAFLMNPLDSKPPISMQQPNQNIQQHRTIQHQNFIDDTIAGSPKVSVIKQHSSSQAYLQDGM